MKFNRRQRRSDDLVDQTDDEDGLTRADSDGDLDADGLDPDGLDADGLGSDGVDPLDGLSSDELDADGLDSDGDRDRAPLGRRGRRSGGTLVEPEVPVARPRPSVGGAPGPARTTPRQFLHEVNVEMRKVAWPTRKETVNYSSVVFITLAVLMGLIFGLDYGFNHLAIYLFK